LDLELAIILSKPHRSANRVHRLKCNREKPCQNCVVRGDSTAASCSYAEKANGKHSGKSNPRKDAEDMRKRINRLEKSILSMMEGDQISGKISESPLLQVNEEDSMTGDEDHDQAGGQMMYTDTRSTHWDAILNDVSVEIVFNNGFSDHVMTVKS
jgi:hypothetical protein